jgi:hypothetical protein
MDAKNITIEQMQKALTKVNKKYKGNIAFRYIEQNGRRVSFTLTVNSSKGPGGRRGFSGRRVSAACWHAHGNFFECVFSICPDAVIISRGIGVTITRAYGNWQDKNIGSQIQPLYYSEACDCAELSSEALGHPNGINPQRKPQVCEDCLGIDSHEPNCLKQTEVRR